MSPLAEPPGLVNMIRLAAVKEINGGEEVQEWLDSHYPDPAVVGLLADYMAEKWGTLDQAWWMERFGRGDLSAEEVTAEPVGPQIQRGRAAGLEPGNPLDFGVRPTLSAKATGPSEGA